MWPKYLGIILLTLVLVLLALAVPAKPAHAAGTVGVCDEAHLLAALSGGGTVTFTCSGTITLTSTIFVGVNTTIDGAGQTVTLSGNNAARVFTVNGGATLALNRLTIANGRSGSGGGIYNSGTLSVTNSTFAGNNGYSAAGGGIYNYFGAVNVAASTFTQNSSRLGGGIFSDGGVVSVTGSSFFSNTAETEGGGILSEDSALTVSSSFFAGNRAPTGGAINSTGTANVVNNTFYDNSGTQGAGIANIGGTLTVINSTVYGNNATTGGGIYNGGGTVTLKNTIVAFHGDAGNCYGTIVDGGGIGHFAATTLTVSNSTFSGNRAHNGGGFYNDSESFVVSNSTFVSNTASYMGGGVCNAFRGKIINSTFSGNSASGSYGGGILSLDTLLLQNTIVANSPQGGNCRSVINDGGGNLSYPDMTCPGINANPVLGPLQNNGGSTPTMALGTGSAAINAGNDTICAAAPVNNLDQRGVRRPQGAHCDIGAVEQQPSSPPTAEEEEGEPDVLLPARLYLPAIVR
jgi:predicted outer membrane repeat protein